MRSAAILAATLLAGAALTFAAPAGFPDVVTLPDSVKTKGKVTVESYGQREFRLKDKQAEVVRGRKWSGWVEAGGYGKDDRQFLEALAESLVKGGWEVLHRDAQRNPPLATLRRTADGKELWASLEGGPRDIALTVIERGAPSAKLQLEPPTAGIDNVSATADFSFLQRFPGSQFVSGARDERPLLVKIEAEKEPVQVASATVAKVYRNPAGTGALDAIAVYRDALTAAGWQVVHENTAITTSDPNLTARYAKGPLDLWVHIRAQGDGYRVAVGDAGADRASTRLKSELDKACKVAIYGVNFDFDKATLRADAEPALGAILKLLNDYPDLKVELGGHTDNVGTRDYNTKLSEARVYTVRLWLAGKGVKGERLTSKGYADTQPVDTNGTPEGRAKNRRVELRKPDCRNQAGAV